MTASTTPESAASELENLVSDVRGLLASKDLDGVPQIKALRKRIDDTMVNVRETAVETAHEAARKAREAAHTANNYAHDEPWQIAGAALAIGVVLGYAVCRR